jgi:Tfp pilus assembly protein PilF
VIEGASSFQKAEICLKRNDLAQAEMLCRKAYESDKKQPDYLALLAWLESMKPENQTPKATLERVAMLDRAVQLNENCERAYFYRGMLHKKLSNASQATRDFRKAVDLNPRNVDAAREVRLFEMRKGRSSAPPPESPGSGAPKSMRSPSMRNSSPPEPKGGGLLGKLFKK